MKKRRSLRGQPGQLLPVEQGGIEQVAEDIVLALRPGSVPHPDRAATTPAAKMVERPLGEVALSPDAVHDL